MAILSQFLASLANDVRRGKMLTDLDTARQSTRFLKDEFLRLLPITRIDMDQVSIRFKMAVSEVLLPLKESEFFSQLHQKLAPKVLQKTKRIKLTADDFYAAIAESAVLTLVPELTEMDPSLTRPIGDSLSKRFSQHFGDRFAKIVPDYKKEEKEQVLKAAKNEFVRLWTQYSEKYQEDLAAQLLKELGRLDVVVEGHKLKEFPSDALVELELHLVPKTYHWALKPEYIEKPEAPVEERYTLMPGG